MSGDGLPNDPALPGLEVAGDQSAMREIFRARLRPLVGDIGEIQDCVLGRVRYRPGERCLLGYTLRLVDPATGRERSQWVTGALYGDARAGATYRKLRTSSSERQIPDALRTFEPVGYVPELDMLVQVFPYDRRLPTLPAVLAGPSPELERLLLTRARIGNPAAVTWQVEVIRYRPQLGAVVRYRVRGGGFEQGQRSFYVKVYPDETGEQTFRLMHRLHERVPRERGLEVDEPVAYLSELRTLVLDEAAGISLEQTLLEGRDAVAAARQVAVALAAFHSEPLVTTRRYTLADYIADLGRIGTLLGWACPGLKSEVERIVGKVAAGIEAAPPAPTHRDLKPAHVFLEGDRLRIIDLDAFAGADALQDAASLAVRLATVRALPPGSRGQMQDVSRIFLDAYLPRIPRDWHGQLRYHYAAAVLDAAAGFFRTQQPGWRERAAELIGAASNTLTGGGLRLTI